MRPILEGSVFLGKKSRRYDRCAPYCIEMKVAVIYPILIIP